MGYRHATLPHCAANRVGKCVAERITPAHERLLTFSLMQIHVMRKLLESDGSREVARPNPFAHTVQPPDALVQNVEIGMLRASFDQL